MLGESKYFLFLFLWKESSGHIRAHIVFSLCIYSVYMCAVHFLQFSLGIVIEYYIIADILYVSPILKGNVKDDTSTFQMKALKF